MDIDNILANSLFLSSDEKDLLMPSDAELDPNVPLPDLLSLLPLRNMVIFPGIVSPITVGRGKSIQLIHEAHKNNQYVGAITQKQPQIDNPKENDLFPVGTIAQIVKIINLPDGAISVIVQGKKRFSLQNVVSDTPYLQAKYELWEENQVATQDAEFDVLVVSIKDLAVRIIELEASLSPESIYVIKNIEDTPLLINFIVANIHLPLTDRQKVLEIHDQKEQMLLLLDLLTRELQLLELKIHIQGKVKVDLDQQQREYMLQQQMKAIQSELGNNQLDQEFKHLAESAQKKQWGEDVAKIFDRELKKLERLNPSSVEYSSQLNYLYILLDLPWNEYTADHFDLWKAKKVLDKEHFGLNQVKERLLEHLSVLKLKKDLKSPIICLLGPPGVGKTSLGKSIALALNRKYARMSLGGLHDEAEIRGHRRTYIGAMPGRIIQSLRKIKSANPVFVLDEIDKLGISVQGDPASALLEVLDPEQNSTFYDNFLEMEFDLSKVMFIATANTLMTVSPALRDRMEVIEVDGYVTEEKLSIAQKHLIPKQMVENGLKKSQLTFNPEAITEIIENYTRESGVRELDKCIATVIRNIAKKIVMRESYDKVLRKEGIKEILGSPKYIHEKYQGNEYAGVVTGLAWTTLGGDILFIETSLSRGTGVLTLTGNLGAVMKESAVIALEYIKAHCRNFNISHEVFNRWNVHVHVPDGAIPKDGPSAGLTILTAMISAFTQKKVRPRIAMTGEITLRGKILQVGGIREKILAAKRADIVDIILPVSNKKDIEEVDELLVKGLNFIYVDDVSEVIPMVILEEQVKNAQVID